MGVTDVPTSPPRGAGDGTPRSLQTTGRQLQVRDFTTRQLLAAFHMPGHGVNRAVFDGYKFVVYVQYCTTKYWWWLRARG